MTKALQPDLSAWCDQPGLKKQLHPGDSTLHLLFLWIPTSLSQRGFQLVNTNPLESAWERWCFSWSHIPGTSLLKLLHFRAAHKKKWQLPSGFPGQGMWGEAEILYPALPGGVLSSSPISWVKHVHTWCAELLSPGACILHLSPNFYPRLIPSFQSPRLLVWIHLQPSSLHPCLQQGSGWSPDSLFLS